MRLPVIKAASVIKNLQKIYDNVACSEMAISCNKTHTSGLTAL